MKTNSTPLESNLRFAPALMKAGLSGEFFPGAVYILNFSGGIGIKPLPPLENLIKDGSIKRVCNPN